jgi:hypothetical protein
MKMSSTILIGLAFGIAACGRVHPRLDTSTITFDYLSVAEAMDLARPYLSRQGTLYHPREALNALTVTDDHARLTMIREVIAQADAVPETVMLHFQVVRAREDGARDPALRSVASALDGLLRFNGYELMGETVVSVSEERSVEQRVRTSDSPLHLAVKLQDVRTRRGKPGEGSVDVSVALRGPGGASLLSTNVIIPLGQTVVVGSAYPGAAGEALILAVRPEIVSRNLRPTRKVAQETPDRVVVFERQADTVLAHFGEDSMSADIRHGVYVGEKGVHFEEKRIVPTPSRPSARKQARPLPPPEGE